MNIRKSCLVSLFLTAIFAGDSSQAAAPRSDSIPIPPSAAQIMASADEDAASATKLRSPLYRQPEQLLSSQQKADRDRSGIKNAVSRISIDATLLRAPRIESGATGNTAFGGHPSGAQSFSLTLEGREYIFHLVSETPDFTRGITHVSASVLNVVGGYARFSVDGNSNSVVGTVTLPDRIYRIVPDGSPEHQLLLRTDVDGARANDREELLAKPSGPLSGSDYRLERAHLQMRVLAELQPSRVRLNEQTGTLYLQGGDLGKVQAGKDTVKTVRNILERLTPLIQDPAAFDIELVRVLGSRDPARQARTIVFRQLIGGIPVERRNEVRIGDDGKIIAVDTSLIDPARVHKQSRMAETDALRIAIDAVHKETRASGDVALVIPATLSYRVQKAGLEIVPVYRFVLEAGEGQRRTVLVNALTGEVQVGIADLQVLGDQFRHRVCNGGSPNCNSGSLVLTELPPSGGQIVDQCHMWFGLPGIGPCYEDSYPFRRMYTIVASVNAAMEQSTVSDPGLCCTAMGGANNMIDVTPGGPATSYSPDEDTIYGGPYSANSDAIAHEVGHAYVKAYNPILSFDTRTDSFALAVGEGLSDAFAAVWAEIETDSYFSTGNKWTIGDGYDPLPVNKQRNLTSVRGWSDLTTPGEEHARGATVGYFFYKLKQSGAFTNARLYQYIMEVSRQMSDDAADGYDLSDFHQALLDALLPTETSLKAAVDAAFSSMNNISPGPGGPGDIPAPPGTPSPPGVPTAPINVHTISAEGCGFAKGIWMSFWTVGWNASSGATRYDAFFLVNNVWTFDDSATGTTASAGANFNTKVRLRACNTVGCSALSTTFATINHTLCN